MCANTRLNYIKKIFQQEKVNELDFNLVARKENLRTSTGKLKTISFLKVAE